MGSKKKVAPQDVMDPHSALHLLAPSEGLQTEMGEPAGLFDTNSVLCSMAIRFRRDVRAFAIRNVRCFRRILCQLRSSARSSSGRVIPANRNSMAWSHSV